MKNILTYLLEKKLKEIKKFTGNEIYISDEFKITSLTKLGFYQILKDKNAKVNNIKFIDAKLKAVHNGIYWFENGLVISSFHILYINKKLRRKKIVEKINRNIK